MKYNKNRLHPVVYVTLNLVLILGSAYLMCSAYTFWRTDTLNSVLLNAIDDRSVSAITETRDGTTVSLDDDEIDYFVYSWMGYDMSEDNALPIHLPSNIIWEREVLRQPHSSISNYANEIHIKFDNNETLIVYYTNCEVQVNDVNYTLCDNPLNTLTEENR